VNNCRFPALFRNIGQMNSACNRPDRLVSMSKFVVNIPKCCSLRRWNNSPVNICQIRNRLKIRRRCGNDHRMPAQILNNYCGVRYSSAHRKRSVRLQIFGYMANQYICWAVICTHLQNLTLLLQIRNGDIPDFRKKGSLGFSVVKIKFATN